MNREINELFNKILESICTTCKIHNPQHKDCTSCPEIDYFRNQIQELNK